jgi:competence ComEA-like helix-hairpin-helix protein
MSNREYLSFTRKERGGIIMLVFIVLMVAVVPKYLFPEKKVIASPEHQLPQKVTYQPIDAVTRQEGARLKYPPRAPVRHPVVMHQRPLQVVNINAADTAAFIALPGIGSKLASRIVLFREKLGGFYSVEQIREVYGLQDSVFEKIKPALRCDASATKKIRINAVEKEELKSHPYIRWQLANILVQYRTMHGAFMSAADLRKIDNLDSAAIEKMLPYLTFD